MSAADLSPLLEQILSRLASIESSLGVATPAPIATSPSPSSVTSSAPALAAYDEFLSTYLPPLTESSSILGNSVKDAAQEVVKSFTFMRNVINASTQCKEPKQEELLAFITPVQESIRVISGLTKRDEWEKFNKTVSEGIGCLSWIFVKPPTEFVESYIGGSDYWANAIRKEFRTTKPEYCNFVDSFKKLLQELLAYIKKHYIKGLTWKTDGKNFSDFNPSTTPVAAPVAAPASTPAPTSTSSAKPASSPAGNLFAELNKEGGITSGLKKVTKEMQTWREEYKGSSAPAPVAPTPTQVKKVDKNLPKGPPRQEYITHLSKWLIENEINNIELNIENKKDVVYIYNCYNNTIKINNKCKNVIVDTCKKVTVYVENCMAQLEVVNSQSINIHIIETVPSVSVDKTDGFIVHLSPTSMDTTIVASKSSEMNVTFLDKDGERVEKPIPEQYVHKVVNGAVTADISDLYTH